MTTHPPKEHLFEAAARRWSAPSAVDAIASLIGEMGSPPAPQPPAAEHAPDATPPLPDDGVDDGAPARPVISAASLRRLARRDGAGGRRSRQEEEIRLIAMQVLRAVELPCDAPARNVVMISSARPGEGRTHVALNLALALAETATGGVVLADLNPGPQSLTQRLVPDARGAADDVASLLATGISGLSILPAPAGDQDEVQGDGRGDGQGGGPTGAPTGAHGGRRTGTAARIIRLAGALPRRLVILDAPPCLSDSDASGLAAVVGHTLLVVGAGTTPRNAVEASLDLLQPCANVALVLNNVKVRTGFRFGDYR